MARTKQTERPSTEWKLWWQRFHDHTGASAIRIGESEVSRGEAANLRTDFSQDPVFCFQVYSNTPPNLDNVPRDGHGSFDDIRGPLAAIWNLMGESLHKPDVPRPMWELYHLPDKNVLGFVAHSRQEIAHRKALRSNGDFSAPLIPKLVRDRSDWRAMGFLFGVNFDVAIGDDFMPLPTERGPLWVHFDPRTPSTVVKPNHLLRLEEAPSVHVPEEEIRIWTEQVDTIVLRIQNFFAAQSSMALLMSKSYYNTLYTDGERERGLDFGLQDEGTAEVDIPAAFKSDHLESDAVAELSLGSEKKLQRNNDGSITISNVQDDTQLDLRYIVYVPFLQRPSVHVTIDHVAKAFVAAIQIRMATVGGKYGRNKTFEFTFYNPPDASDSAILDSYRGLHLAPDFVGLLTTSRGKGPPDLLVPRRLHPLNINPHMIVNDPETCGMDPYRTFVIILDRPDFEDGAAAVRYVLADGGKVLGLPGGGPPRVDFQNADFPEIEVWRSADMENVVRRLLMMPLPDSELAK